MHELETYVMQDAEHKSWVWVFTSKSEAVEEVKDKMSDYVEEGEEIQWNWVSEDECIVKLAGHDEGWSPYRGDFYYIWKDSINLSDKDVKKLVEADSQL